MNENELFVVKEYEFDNPLITKIDSIIHNCYRDCHNEYYHTFKYVCIYDIKVTNITNNETVNFTISDESMNLFELNEKLTLARQRGFKFNQMNQLTKNFYSILSHKIIYYYLKHSIPMRPRQFFRRIARNCDYIQTFCKDRGNPFHFACRQWYLYNNPRIIT